MEFNFFFPSFQIASYNKTSYWLAWRCSCQVLRLSVPFLCAMDRRSAHNTPAILTLVRYSTEPYQIFQTMPRAEKSSPTTKIWQWNKWRDHENIYFISTWTFLNWFSSRSEPIINISYSYAQCSSEMFFFNSVRVFVYRKGRAEHFYLFYARRPVTSYTETFQ